MTRRQAYRQLKEWGLVLTKESKFEKGCSTAFFVSVVHERVFSVHNSYTNITASDFWTQVVERARLVALELLEVETTKRRTIQNEK